MTEILVIKKEKLEYLVPLKSKCGSNITKKGFK